MMSIIKIILGFICCLSFAMGVKASEREISVIPKPHSVVIQSGEFQFNANTLIVLHDHSEAYQKIATALSDRFIKSAGFSLKIKSSPDTVYTRNAIIFKNKAGMVDEAYQLEVNTDCITVFSSSPKGAFYALQTIYQLLPPQIFGQKQKNVKWSVPCVKIDDKPQFSYRGMHLDVCLHFFTVDEIKRYLDLMAMHKLNVFHWHLTEDQGWRIEIKKYPRLTEFGSIRKETVIGTHKSGFYDGTPYGGFYTQEEIKEIVNYAADRFITIIPEIEMPGHALAAIACYPHLSCGLEEKYEVATRWGIFPQVFCPKAETFEFLEDVLTEVMELFPSKYIHIGGDECPKSSWKKCRHCQNLIKILGLKDEFELQSFFIQRIEKFINEKGRQIIGWDEILQGGLAPNATVMSWLGEEGGIKAAQQHHDVIMCPHTKYYLDYYQADPNKELLAMGHLVTLQEVYDYSPVPEVLSDEEKVYIKGIQGCVWTEYMPNFKRVEYMAYPRACAISETAWTQEKNKNWKDFTSRLEKHFERLDQMGVNYCKTFNDVQIFTHKDGPYSNIVTMKVDAPDAIIHYTIDGTTPGIHSPVYSQPFVINKSVLIKAIAFKKNKQIGKETQSKFN
ncbi:MAG TPA: family 20 glycosylhydrolase [Paludibacter sp.]|nr:family 20 glycosylhydrolase [Paludibacter sp.]